MPMFSKSFGLVLLLSLPSALRADVFTFDTVDSLDSLFPRTGYTGNSTLVDRVGVGNSRGIAYTGSVYHRASDLRIYTPMGTPPEALSGEVSICFRNQDQLSFAKPMVGFLGIDQAETHFLSPDLTTPTIYAVAQRNTLWLFSNAGTYLDSANVLPLMNDSDWYQLSLQVEHLGSRYDGNIQDYSLHAAVLACDNEGHSGAILSEISRAFSTSQFQDVPEVYPFFGIDTPDYFTWTGPGFTGAIDNFVVSVPEPSTTLLLLTASGLALGARVWLRYRRRC